jgi:hypothetical protein
MAAPHYACVEVSLGSPFNLAMYGKGVFHMAIKVFNELPNEIKEMYSEPKKFKGKIKNFLAINSFYTVEEFFNR